MSKNEIERKKLIEEIELYCKLIKRQAEKYNINLSNIKFMEG